MPTRKRPWGDSNLPPEDVIWASTPSGSRNDEAQAEVTATPSGKPMAQSIPQISRKIKACAACRKHKIKCMMEDSGPPCKRCAQKNLGCMLNKSLQTLISEKTELSEAMVQDMEVMHAGLKKVTEALNLPPLPQLRSTKLGLQTPLPDEQGNAPAFEDAGPSCDASPMLVPEDDKTLPHVPIHSVYCLTKLSALRSQGAGGVDGSQIAHADDAIDDLVSRGKLSLEDATRLYRLYVDHLDHFMYGIGSRYQTLDALRRGSRILAVCIFTVAALHLPPRDSPRDGQNARERSSIYGMCMAEFRRLMATSLFSRRIDRDHIRAMCIGSYWLSDISWTLSGYGIRRAAELNLAGQYRRAVVDGAEDAVDSMRLWYVLYICDQHLSTLYCRKSIIRGDDNPALRGWEVFLHDSPAITDEDRRLASQVALLNIVHGIRELFDSNDGCSSSGEVNEPIPFVFSMQISGFARQLDRWLAHWSIALPERHEHIGGFPRKGVLLHYHFATLHLHSQVFRGSPNGTVPPHFQSSASAAVAAAMAIMEMLITDPEMRPSLVGMPSHMHSMTGYACMFLAKLALLSTHSELISREAVINLTSQLIALYRSTPVGRWHLVKLMANGLEKIVDTLRARPAVVAGVLSVPPPAHMPNMTPTGPDLAMDGLFDLQTNFLSDSNIMFGGSPLLFLSGGATMFDAADLSPSSFL